MSLYSYIKDVYFLHYISYVDTIESLFFDVTHSKEILIEGGW